MAAVSLLEAAFADIHLKVGEIMVMQHQAGFEQASYTVNFIGGHGQMSFLASLPLVGEQGLWITPGSTCGFRVVHGIYVYAFATRSLRAHSRPYPYAHFAIPDAVQYRQVRQSHRLETRLPVEVERPDGSRTLAIMRDVSEHGARLELTGILGEIGSRIDLQLPVILPERAATIALSATVRNSSDVERAIASGRFLYGVEFAPLAEAEAALLQHFIDHLLVEQLA